jgi:nitrogen regulatory protein PII
VKKLEAIIQLFRMDDVKEALLAIGVDGMALSRTKLAGARAGTS